MESKHSLEKAAAHQSDCFTTVSEITARECEQLLERKPDVVTPNGFEPNFVPAKNKFASVRKAARETLLTVARSLTGRVISDDAFLVATSGRCEYRNKGLDVFLDAMAKLSTKEHRRDIVAFVMVPAWCEAPQQALSDALAEGISANLSSPYMTHTVHNPGDDAILCRMRGLDPEGTVTVIYTPCYLNGSDGIFNKPYYDLLIGMDATVFPSYYEPWGYTPLESVAFGVPTITTSLSGFGQWVCRTFTNDFENCGVVVVDRTDSNYEMVAESIATSLEFLCGCGAEEEKKIAEKARATASCAKWEQFAAFYETAFDIALSNAATRK